MNKTSLAPLGAPRVLHDPDVRFGDAAPSEIALLVWHERLLRIVTLQISSFLPVSRPAGFSHAHPGADDYHCVINFPRTVVLG